MKKDEYISQAQKAIGYYEKANIILTEEEKNRIEVADFGLGRVSEIACSCSHISTPRAFAQRKWCCCLSRPAPNTGTYRQKAETARKKPSAAA